ncbi:MAG TPA: glycosyltransferase [Roseiarcus sp.]|nr:glycosyltransferase [Roseiarcus sp.]
MKLVVFGLTVTSSWGNGHATLWRGLQRALARRGWTVVFFERDTPYYAQNRDLNELPDGELILYREWDEAQALARRHVAEADVAMVTSYCPDGVAAGDLVLAAPRALRAFYDLDTPVTLARLRQGEPLAYIGPRGLGDYDLVLSYTGGAALDELGLLAGARRVVALYGHVDPEKHHPAPPAPRYRAHLSYVGTYAADRQPALQRLFIDPARRRPDLRFVLAGAQYPEGFPWTKNIFFVRHLPPSEHSAFYASSRLTLNVTRRDMAAMGWCPSGRLFEAAACGAAIVSDSWEGLETFFRPEREIIVAGGCTDVIAALDLPDHELRRIGEAARDRVLAKHTSAHRAAELEKVLTEARRGERRNFAGAAAALGA